MQALSDFRPPKPNRLIIGLCELLFPFYLRFVDPLSFEFSESADRLSKFLKDKTTVIVLNHPDKQDPLILIALARYIRDAFYCIAAREVFDWNHGMLGWLFQRLGCYSVNRGTVDFRSIQTTRKILTRLQSKLVVFPEGEVTADDQVVHEVSPALMHILLEAQRAIAKPDPTKSIWLLPIGLSYSLQTSLDESINKPLRAIEHKLSIVHNDRISCDQRVQIAIHTVLKCLAAHYNFVLPDEIPNNEQVRLLAQHICKRISAHVAVESTEKNSTEQLLHCLRNYVVKKMDVEKARSKYERQLRQSTWKTYREFVSDLDRVERLLIFQRVLCRKPSPIQICRMVDFLESETCGQMTAKGRQRASIFIGQPIDLLPFLQMFDSCKTLAIDELSNRVRKELQSALNANDVSKND